MQLILSKYTMVAQPMNYLIVFDHFVGFALKGLNCFACSPDSFLCINKFHLIIGYKDEIPNEY